MAQKNYKRLFYCFSKYSLESIAFGFIASFPGFHPAGQT